ncbi:aspartate aminotransferase family protein [Amorphus orientalis]|uniref:Glutamate-1-semialdehyde 2,1-aminomutase n=1 Tax=Amorphus orientalis TaxID=649198 RepID=A0AAE4AU11_9HYPH|nr:aminotransferase class III-fold pyridoxal phosphate-dependent enzyme [Amorphus orientalis]MDQ0316843.1 glutamate-1-semialdehyde 2,1-aminomutase [Amorphus orientalis]
MTAPSRRLAELRETYAAARPESRRRMAAATQVMPGGNTRSVLHFEPFPMVIAGGEGCRITDVDGHSYIDCAGEFSAGLYGHGDPVIRAAQHKALEDGLALVGPNLYEADFAAELCRRFPSVDKVRFCNSGTEANLFAVLAARHATGRGKVMVFGAAYHGGVMTFSAPYNPMNVPFDFVLAPYNDLEATAKTARAHAADIAAILVEPVLGAAGNIPGEPGFLQGLRDLATEIGALLIFDEVKTSRLGRSGVQGLVGVLPDLTTFGKYLGAGLSFGAFGGVDGVMELFDPARPTALKHAGTFNNNVLSMAGGLIGLREVFTAERAESFLAEGERFRDALSRRFADTDVPVRASGLGSMISLHVGRMVPRRVAEFHPATGPLRQIVHLRCLDMGLATTPRGDIFLSLPMTQATRDEIADILAETVSEEIGPLLSA